MSHQEVSFNQSHIKLLEERNSKIQHIEMEEIKWIAAYVDCQFSLLHPLALQTLLRFQSESKKDVEQNYIQPVTSEFEKQQFQQEVQKQMQIKKSTKSYNINDLQPISLLGSRQCKTEINNHSKKQNNVNNEQSPQFIRKNKEQLNSSNILKSSKISKVKSSKILNKSQNKKYTISQNNKQINYISFHPKMKKQEQVQIQQNVQKQKNKNKDKLNKVVRNKSLLLKNNNVSSYSKDTKKELPKYNNQQTSSKLKIQKLNSAIFQMQQKLHKLENNQKKLLKIDNGQNSSSQLVQQQQYKMKPITKTIKSEQTYLQKINNYKIQPSQKIAQLQQTNTKVQKNTDPSQNYPQKYINIVVSKKQNSNSKASTTKYHRDKEQQVSSKRNMQEKDDSKRFMMEEINQLKNIIRSLKTQKNKHQSTIEQYEKKQKQRLLLEQKLQLNKIKIQKQKQTQFGKNIIQRNEQKMRMKTQPTNERKNKVEKFDNGKKNKKIIVQDNKHGQVFQYKQGQIPKQFRNKGGIIVKNIGNNLTQQKSQSRLVEEERKQLFSPTSTGRKVFQLEFVEAELQQSILSDDPSMSIPSIQIQGFQLPQLPPPPISQISQNDLLQLAKSVCQIFCITIEENQHLRFKKYKNCIVFQTPDRCRTIVWHYSGKFYIGGWEENQEGDQRKNGDGYEYIPAKFWYKGQFYQGRRNGSGIMIMNNRSVYNGQWEKGEKHGQGKQYDSETQSLYQGQWKNGKKDGKGVLKKSDKEYYDGTFLKSVKHGFGSQQFQNGDYYHGQYKSGRFHGKGKYIWSNGSSYDGSFVEGNRDGLGKWKSSKKGGDTYTGYYKNGKKEGSGRYRWANGCAYQGQFYNDLKHGQGRVIYIDGRQIKGYWQKGKLEQIYQKTDDDQNNYIKLSKKTLIPKLVN